MKQQQLINLQMANEVRVFTKADNQKRTQLQLQVDNHQEYNLSYGQDAVLSILPIVEKEVKEMNTRHNQHTKRFYWQLIKPIQNGAEFKGEDSIERTIANIVAVNLTSSLTRETTLTNVSAKMTNNAFHILHVPHDKRREESQHGIKFFSALVMLIAENTDIFTIDQVEGRENRLFLSDEWRKHVEEAQDNYKTSVSGYEPMVCEPTDYTSLVDSTNGYLVSPSPLLKRPTRGDDKRILKAITDFTAETAPDFFSYVNRVAKTPYCVNTRLLEVISAYYEMGFYFKKFPSMNDEEAIEEGATKEIAARNARRASYDAYKGIDQGPLSEATVRKVYAVHTSKMKDQVNKTKALLEMATEYSMYDQFYYPPFLDNRGRLYPYASGSLSIQGDEMAKALIQFSRKETLTKEGMEAMFDTLANTLGHDKKVLEVKRELAISWFYENFETFSAGDFSMFFKHDSNFDEPITALAVVLELIEVAKDPEYQTGFICHRDARVSGSSIIGTAMKDKGIMEMTSVLDWNKDGKLGDAYTEAAMAALALVKADADAGNELAIELFSYSDELFNRSVFKHVVMTWCSYGLTDFSLREYNKSVFNWEEELSVEHKRKFDDIMLKALAIALPACSQFLTVFKKVGAVVAKKEGRISFTNPLSGFPVAFSANKLNKVRVAVAQPFRIIKLNLLVPTGKVDNVAITNAMAPNCIHSIDAALLFRVSHKCEHDLSLIHDSIGSHANHVSKTVEAYAMAMYKVAQSDALNNMLDQLGSDLKLKNINTATDEDVEAIKTSKHILV